MTRCLVAACALLCGATPVEAQRAPTSVGLGFGIFANYPREFRDGDCGGTQGGFTAHVGRALTSSLSIHLGGTLSGEVGAGRCVTPSTGAPAPPDGAPYSATDVSGSIEGVAFFSSHLAALAEPWRFGRVSPRVRVSGGRVWGKKVWTWTYGVGARYALGPHAVVLDVERWNLSYDVRLQTWIFREPGPDEFVAETVVTRRPRPWLFRLSWEMEID